jgi:predicted aspartyl protease
MDKSNIAYKAKIFLIIMFIGCTKILPMNFVNPVSANEKNVPQNHSLPMPKISMLENVVEIPFTVDPNFPAPVVKVTIAGQGPFRFVVDTGMSGTILVRKRLADSLNFGKVGYAMAGDGSHHNMKKVPLVLIDSVVVGKLVITNIVSVSMEASVDHAASIPDELDGILGMQLFSDLVLTIDYPNSELRIQNQYGDQSLKEDFIPYSYEDNAIEIQVDFLNQTIPLFVDSGHRGTITLPKSYSEVLLLSEPLQSIGKIATVTNTYSRERSRLNGSVGFAGFELLNPPIVFTEEDSPRLLGYGVLEHFEITIDQKNRLIRFARASSDPIGDVHLFEEQI